VVHRRPLRAFGVLHGLGQVADQRGEIALGVLQCGDQGLACSQTFAVGVGIPVKEDRQVDLGVIEVVLVLTGFHPSPTRHAVAGVRWRLRSA
jgi:hypothetical protein